jgi:hypothetical protein
MEIAIDNQLWLRQLIVFVAVIGGIYSIFLGYRLLIKGITDEFKLKSDLKGFKADLVSVSPGLFFALIGLIIIWAALNHGFEFKVESKPIFTWEPIIQKEN